MKTLREEHSIEKFGLDMSARAVIATDEGRILNQKILVGKEIQYYGKTAQISVEMRLDDNCRNGHEDFAITGDIRYPSRRDFETGGCIHDEIAKHFPQLKHLIKWHLTGIHEPMYYVQNTIYHASDKDCWGKRKGEPTHFDQVVRFADSPVQHKLSDKFAEFLKQRQGTGDFKVMEVPHINRDGDDHDFDPKYTFIGYERAWHRCPFDTKLEAENFAEAMNRCRAEFSSIPTMFSKGKERDFEAARSCANWPEATEEQLSLPEDQLRELLLARLPKLMAEFKKDMIDCGFIWPTLPAGKRGE